jgi:hypothetical protein
MISQKNGGVNLFKTDKRLYKFFLFIFAFALLFLPFFLSVNNAAQAQSKNLRPASTAESKAVAAKIAASNCPDPIKSLILDSKGNLRPGYEFYLDGSFVVAKDSNKQPIALTCANASNLQKIAVRVILMIFALAGAALAFGVGKATIFMMVSRESKDFGEAVMGLVRAVLYTLGLFLFYLVLVFIIIGVFGFGRENPDRPEYNLFCQQQIIYNITFDDSVACS